VAGRRSLEEAAPRAFFQKYGVVYEGRSRRHASTWQQTTPHFFIRRPVDESVRCAVPPAAGRARQRGEQDDPGTNAYFILTGGADVLLESDDGRQFIVACLVPATTSARCPC
jgi:CRP-like cAMP-binding protein